MPGDKADGASAEPKRSLSLAAGGRPPDQYMTLDRNPVYDAWMARQAGDMAVIGGVGRIAAGITVGIYSGGLAWVWSADQIATGWSEITTATPQHSVGGQIIHNVAGNGWFASVLEFVYDNLPPLAVAAVTTPRAAQAPARSGVQPYDVGPINELRSASRVGDDLALHHVGQQHPMGQVVPGYNPQTAPAIVLPTAEHQAIPNLTGTYSGTARQLLARDIRNLRNYTNAPNSSLLELIDLNRKMYPGAFAK